VLDYPESSEDGVYHVFALQYARQTGRLAKDLFLPSPQAAADGHDGLMPSAYYIWIIHNRFRTIVVDCGISPRASASRNRPLDVDPIEALGRLGIDAGTVENLIITHLHFDHASNLHRFEKALIHVQETEVRYVTGPCMCEPFLQAPFDVEDVVTLIRRLYSDRVLMHSGEAEPFPGVSLHVLPGHSAGIQAVRVSTPRGPVLLASDVTHFYANLIQRRPFRVTIDVAATLHSFWRLKQIAGSIDRVIPGHDPKVREIYPTYQVNGVELIALHENPAPHSLEDLVRLPAE